MSTRLRLGDLRKIIAEETKKILVEAEKPEEEKGEDSLDAQIDQFLMNYEVESKNAKNEGKDFRSLVLRLLREAEEDEEEDKGDEEAKDDEEGEEEEPAAEEQKKLTIEDIDIENFSDNVVRLIDNYDSLLEVRNTILRRAANFILKGYEPDVVESFKETIMERHGLEIGQSKYEHEDEDFQAPTADRAGVSPGGS